MAIRAKETKLLINLNIVKFMGDTILRYSGYFAMVVIMYIKTASGSSLEAGPAFSLLASFTFLSLYFGFFLGHAILTFAEFKTTLSRTAQILLLEEKRDRVKLLDNETGEVKECENDLNQ